MYQVTNFLAETTLAVIAEKLAGEPDSSTAEGQDGEWLIDHGGTHICTVSTPCQTSPELSPALTAASQHQCYILDYWYGQKLELKALPLLYSAKLANGSVSTKCSSTTKLEWIQSKFALSPQDRLRTQDPTCG